MVESWGHFPAEKERLVNLMKKIDPSGLVFLSGDVHHGELSKARIVRERGESLWVEITSSGMTHTCGDSMFNSVLCPKMLETFSEHRLQSRGPPNVEEETPLLTTDTSQRNTAKNENYYIGKNFGLITDSSNSTMYALNFTVIGIDSKKTELNYIVQSIRRNCRKKNSDEFTDIGIEQDADSREYSCFPDPIMTVEVADFPLFIREEVKKKAQEILGAVLLAMLFYFLVCSFTFYVKKRQ